MSGHVVMFSGGAGSWGAARRLADEGADLTLLFADTKMEDESVYSFLDAAAADIGAPLVRIEDGRDIWQVFRDVRFLGNTRADPCSRILKRDLMRKWLEDNRDPADTTVVLGFDWSEAHRFERAEKHWAPWPVIAPLCDPPYRSKADLIAELGLRGIEPPRLYAMGFPHANCGGGCVKAGQSQFALLLDKMPDRYAEWERHEEELRVELGDVAILRDRTGGDTKPLTLAALRGRIEAGRTVPMFDFGGCACMEEPE